MYRLIALTFILCTGCMGWQMPIAGHGYDGPTNDQPMQALAVALVWNQTYGMTAMLPPPIMWHFNDNCVDALTKNGPAYGTPGAFHAAHSDGCEYGQYESSGWVETTEFDAPNRIDLEWNGSFSAKQAMAHELCHAYLQYTTGDGDDSHTSKCF
ncbi:MAG TPA: hypothetical protein VHD33_00240, partial [Legionellaceae bacterium]|nr:hypothetical protein [Legionellaceae bacterium]